MEPVRFGLVGYGFGGRYFHAPLIASAAECRFMGVVTSSEQRRALVEAEHPGTSSFGSLAELVDAGVEAVAISTPADTHSALTEQALKLGLAVVCDKPFALDANAARQTVALAEDLKLPLSPYQNRRLDSDFRTVQQLVSEGALGDLTCLESRFERFAPAAGPGHAGGGTLLDFGSHLVDQALVLLGPVESVYADLRIRESGLDDDVFLALRHHGGTRSLLWGSWSQAAPGPRFRVTGTTGSYLLATGDTQEDALVAGDTPTSLGADWGAEPAESRGIHYTGTGADPVPTLPGRWNEFYPTFAGAVRGTNPPPVNPRDAIATATVLDAARLSASTHTVVEIRV